ncbi:MAG TPA: FapA family protein [bacterium]|nr:FapA family protein [bacterium]
MIRVRLSPIDSSGGGNSSLSSSSDSRKNDGYLEVAVSQDCMTATAILYPPMGDGAPLTPDFAAELLNRLGVSNGILWDVLADRILETNTEHHILQDIVIARGVEPIPEYPEHIVLDEEYTAGFKPPTEENDAIDWKSISPVIIAKKDERLGTVLPRQEGIPGSDVHSKAIPFAKLARPTYTLGKNVERVDDAIVAAKEGRVIVDGQKISIEEVLTIKGDVDYRVGHVLFPGDVIIEGGVSAGFKVYAGGSISIRQTMDAFDVSAKRDLLCAQGIIGKEQGHVRVGGDLKAKFMENAKVAVRGNVDIPGSIVGSKLYTLGRVSMGDKGRIVGGEMFATHGVHCGWIGGATRPLTIINVGIDFTIQQKLDQASEALRELSMRLARLQELYKARPEEAIKKSRDQTEARLRDMAQNIAELSTHVDIDDSAVVEVHNGVFPGVVITICHIRTTIEEPLKKSLFKLDHMANRILVEH